MKLKITISKEAAEGYAYQTALTGADTAAMVLAAAENKGIAYLHDKMRGDRKKVIQKIEQAPAEQRVDLYEMADKILINPDAFQADVTRIYDEELAKIALKEEELVVKK